MKKFMTFFVFSCLLLGIQQSSFAQLRVYNATQCTLYVYAGEAGFPCTLCFTTATVQVLPNQSIQFNATCSPEFWKGIAFSTSSTGPNWGYTYNQTVPFPYTCTPVANSGITCGLNTINGFMFGGGLGPKTIVIS